MYLTCFIHLLLYYSYGCYNNYYSSFYITAVNPLSTLFLFQFYHLFWVVVLVYFCFQSVVAVERCWCTFVVFPWLARHFEEFFLSFTFFFLSFQRQRLTQGPFRRFNSGKQFNFGYNSFDPTEFHSPPCTSFSTPFFLLLSLYCSLQTLFRRQGEKPGEVWEEGNESRRAGRSKYWLCLCARLGCVVNNYCRVRRLVILLLRKKKKQNNLSFKLSWLLKHVTESKLHQMGGKKINMAINVPVLYSLFLLFE